MFFPKSTLSPGGNRAAVFTAAAPAAVGTGKGESSMEREYQQSQCTECLFAEQCAKFDRVAEECVNEIGDVFCDPDELADKDFCEDAPGQTPAERMMSSVTATVAKYLRQAFCHGVHGASDEEGNIPVNLGQMATGIIRQILALVNRGSVVSFEEDWGDNTITVVIDHAHSHCGFPDGDFVALVDSLHDLLVNGRGLSFVKDR